MSNKSTWQIVTEFKINAFLVDDEWLLFHSGTGATHRLNGIYGMVFSIFWVDRPVLNANDLVMSISKQFGLVLALNEIKQAVDALLELCLIKSVDCLG